MVLLLASLASLAAAADAPSLWARQGVAVAGWPSGLLSNTIAEARTPLHRSDSIVFRGTYAGVGAQVLASPAFVIAGPRVSFAPIDVLDVNLKAARGWYFGNGLGLLPFDGLGGTLDAERNARLAEGVGAEMWILTVEPTLKAKVGPVIAFDAWTVDWLSVERPAGLDAPFTYEPLRDLVIGWEDVAVEHHAGLLFEVLPGGDRPMLRLGPTFRDRFARESGDRSAVLGAMVAARPGTAPTVPTIVGLATWYVVDTDRVGPVPFVALQARWELELPMKGP